MTKDNSDLIGVTVVGLEESLQAQRAVGRLEIGVHEKLHRGGVGAEAPILAGNLGQVRRDRGGLPRRQWGGGGDAAGSGPARDHSSAGAAAAVTSLSSWRTWPVTQQASSESRQGLLPIGSPARSLQGLPASSDR